MMIERLILVSPRVEIYEELFSSSASFKKVLRLVYTDIIEFCRKATALGKRNPMLTSTLFQ
jgi:hypothetical protein